MTVTDTQFGVWDDSTVPVFYPAPFNPLDYAPLTSDAYVTRTKGWATTFGQRKSPSTLTTQTEVSTTMATGVVVASRAYDNSNGLYQIDSQDPTSQTPQTKTNTVGKKPARSAVVAGAARKMYFQVDHRWQYQMGNGVHLSVVVQYYDLGFNGSSDKLSLVYDGQSGNVTHATTFTLGNTKTWKQALWSFTDGYFGGRLLSITNIGSVGDFYITHPDSTDLWVTKVIVSPTDTTNNTYFYLLDPTNSSNIQASLSTKFTPNPQIVQTSAELSASGSYDAAGATPPTNNP